MRGVWVVDEDIEGECGVGRCGGMKCRSLFRSIFTFCFNKTAAIGDRIFAAGLD